ncbi:MAG TPA: hydrogenase expression/formation C-terminal domain-containing protein [Steroidobacteraceae bacterium]|nr:hydrogenase expression/formation C-terminal domain-containing protein [Steroidobacteraceae bacterium]
MNNDGVNDALKTIKVKVEPTSPDEIDAFTLNVVPLLHEVKHALQRLLETGEPTTIDLGSIPLAPGEFEKIDAALGTGEVKVALEAMGPSQIYETQFSGVWRVTHFNAANEVVGRYVEVTRMPEILLAQETDVRIGLDLLSRKLSGEID